MGLTLYTYILQGIIMAISSITSSPSRFGQGQTSPTNDRGLFLDVFGGEVLTAFDMATVTLDKHNVKTVGGGQRSFRFPKTWKASAEYHVPGTELMGTEIETGEISITIDDILVSHTAVSDIDTMLSHFDVRSEYSAQMGRALARVFDKNVFRQIIMAARTAADGPFPGGDTITGLGVASTGAQWIDAIRLANLKFFNLSVPEEQTRYMSVTAETFNKIKFAKDANGQYLVLDADLRHSGAGGIEGRADSLTIDGVQIVKSLNMPSADESADTTVYSKYRANYATTVGCIWTADAVATVKLMDIGFESERDTRRLEDFLVAKMLTGHGTLRPECAIELTA